MSGDNYLSMYKLLYSCRRICDEDDDLAEVTPDTVPDEVREWLAATFTRQAAAPKREKPKFKSVANAIRTGIFFDKCVIAYFIIPFQISRAILGSSERLKRS